MTSEKRKKEKETSKKTVIDLEDSIGKSLQEAGILKEGSEESPLDALARMQKAQMKKLQEAGILKEGSEESPLDALARIQKAQMKKLQESIQKENLNGNLVPKTEKTSSQPIEGSKKEREEKKPKSTNYQEGLVFALEQLITQDGTNNFLIIEMRGDYYLQFSGEHGGKTLYAEAVSNEYLPKKSKLNSESIDLLCNKFGFEKPKEPGNFSRSFDVSSPQLFNEIAQLIFKVGENVYGLKQGNKVSLELVLESSSAHNVLKKLEKWFSPGEGEKFYWNHTLGLAPNKNQKSKSQEVNLTQKFNEKLDELDELKQQLEENFKRSQSFIEFFLQENRPTVMKLLENQQTKVEEAQNQSSSKNAVEMIEKYQKQILNEISQLPVTIEDFKLSEEQKQKIKEAEEQFKQSRQLINALYVKQEQISKDFLEIFEDQKEE